MYGYVRPARGELRVRELTQFRTVYCGLCEALRRRYGFAARFLVNYDLTFLAMLLAEGGGCEKRRRCPVHPLRPRPCLCGEPSLELAADYCVILAFEKLRDDLRDEPFLRSLLKRLALPLLRRWHKRAAAARPGFAQAVNNGLERLAALERESCGVLDKLADCFAGLLAAAAEGAAQPERREILRQLLYHMGRSVYILDAVDDLPEDMARGRFNPLRTRFELQSGALSAEDRLALRGTLNLSQRSMAAACALLPEGPWTGILENTVTEGLPAVTELIFAGKWRREKKKADIEPA